MVTSWTPFTFKTGTIIPWLFGDLVLILGSRANRLHFCDLQLFEWHFEAFLPRTFLAGMIYINFTVCGKPRRSWKLLKQSVLGLNFYLLLNLGGTFFLFLFPSFPTIDDFTLKSTFCVIPTCEDLPVQFLCWGMLLSQVWWIDAILYLTCPFLSRFF